MQNNVLKKVTTVAFLLALLVVMLGAYTRLSDAGLGCPDWPGCYGKMVLPSADKSLQEAQTHYPQIPIESRKAWTEMIHRYAAGTLALLIFYIGLSVLRKRYQGSKMPWHIAAFLFFLVIFQAALGMWTVTLKLLPVVVMSHLLGGMLIVASLARFRLQLDGGEQDLPSWRPWVCLGVLIVFIQIALGGWVSSNYAGIACIGFPRCNGLWLPSLHFAQGFNLFAPIGENYQGGLLESDVRITIQMIHRFGALLTAVYVLLLAFIMMVKSNVRPLKTCALLLVVLVFVQFVLGILNVVYLLPIQVAVAHNGVAALLLTTMLSMLHFSARKPNDAK